MAERDIIISPATIYRAPVGTALPSASTVEYGEAWTAPWENLGYTLNPLAINRAEEVLGVDVQQLKTPIKRRRQAETLTVKTVFAETTTDVAQLYLAGIVTLTAAGPAVREMEEVEFGGQDQIDEYCWGFEGVHIDDDGNEWPARFFIYRGTAAPDGDMVLDKANPTGIPIMITGVPDATKVKGKQLGKLQKVTGDVTP